MIEHVFCRAAMFGAWDGLYLATCDHEIAEFGVSKGWPVLMTGREHVRCLDRVAEAAAKCGQQLTGEDVVVCVQGDEPMLHPDMITAVVQPMLDEASVPCTVLAMEIVDEAQFRNPDTVKIVHDDKGDVLYTSRAPVPYCRAFTRDLGARRIYGVLAFRWRVLEEFRRMPESRLERLEACDSNRILGGPFRQRIAPYPARASFSVDSPADVATVETHIAADPLWGKY